MQVAPELHTMAPFSHIQFSADGKLMLCVAEGRIYQIDAFGGTLLQTYSTGIPEGTKGPAAIFSPDSRYILSGRLLPSNSAMIQVSCCVIVEMLTSWQVLCAPVCPSLISASAFYRDSSHGHSIVLTMQSCCMTVTAAKRHCCNAIAPIFS